MMGSKKKGSLFHLVHFTVGHTSPRGKTVVEELRSSLFRSEAAERMDGRNGADGWMDGSVSSAYEELPANTGTTLLIMYNF